MREKREISYLLRLSKEENDMFIRVKNLAFERRKNKTIIDEVTGEEKKMYIAKEWNMQEFLRSHIKDVAAKNNLL